MKTVKLFGLITMVAIMALGMVGCDNGTTSTGGNQTPVAGDYDISGNASQTAGSVTAFTVTAKSGKSGEEVTVYYTGTGGTTYAKNTAVPQTAGTYAVTFDVAAAAGWNAAAGLSAGTLTVNAAGGNNPVIREYQMTTIGSGVTTVGYQAFSNLTGLDSLTINTKAIVNWFAGTSLKSVTIGDSVEGIDANAFQGCTGLTSFTIPAGVTSIGSGAFQNCTGLESLTIPFVGNTLNGATNIVFGYIFGATGWSDQKTFVPASLKTVVITSGNSIETSAFYECTNLTIVTIPASVTSIGQVAFNLCASLTSVTFEGTVSSSSFDTATPFLGDLRAAFYAGNAANGVPGTYTTTAPVTSSSV